MVANIGSSDDVTNCWPEVKKVGALFGFCFVYGLQEIPPTYVLWHPQSHISQVTQ